jgi:hypothetical protein
MDAPHIAMAAVYGLKFITSPKFPARIRGKAESWFLFGSSRDMVEIFKK